MSFKNSHYVKILTLCGLAGISFCEVVGEINNYPIETLYVGRRSLSWFSGLPDAISKVNVAAHSALLAKTPNGYYVIEYMDDGEVHVVEATNVTVDTFQEDGYDWSKQEQGIDIGGTKTVDEIASLMDAIMSSNSYDMLHHNCHMAQESTRLELGYTQMSELSYPDEDQALVNGYQGQLFLA